MDFIEKIKSQVKQNKKTIVLAETEDIRTLKAAEIVKKEGFANIVLIGIKEEINILAEKEQINIEGITIINPKEFSDFDKLKEEFYETNLKVKFLFSLYSSW